jgi:hypothetical protein
MRFGRPTRCRNTGAPALDERLRWRVEHSDARHRGTRPPEAKPKDLQGGLPARSGRLRGHRRMRQDNGGCDDPVVCRNRNGNHACGNCPEGDVGGAYQLTGGEWSQQLYAKAIDPPPVGLLRSFGRDRKRHHHRRCAALGWAGLGWVGKTRASAARGALSTMTRGYRASERVTCFGNRRLPIGGIGPAESAR